MTLEEELPRLFGELADDHVVGPPPVLGAELRVEHPPQQRPLLVLGLAAAACVAVVVGGLVVLSGRNADDPVVDQPTDPRPAATVPPDEPPTTGDLDTVVLLAPPADSGMNVREGSVQVWGSSAEVSGAVVAPDGTVFTIAVSPVPSRWLPDTADWESIPVERRALDTVAGREVAASIDGSAPDQIYRAVHDDCWNINITTADAPMWSPDFATLVEAMSTNAGIERDEGPAVIIDVPDGWTSLGGGAVPAGLDMGFVVEVDGVAHDVSLTQRPDAPVGVMVYGESNPVPFDHDGRQWWAIDVVTTPSWNTVVGETELGAFRITSDLSTDQLVAIVDELVPTSLSRIPRTMNDPISTAPQQMVDVADTVEAASRSCGWFGNGLALIGS